jgi:ABC-type arginine transport system ATPase subunit
VKLVSKAEGRRVKSAFAARQEAQDTYSVNAPAGTGDYFARTRRIERVVLKNFKVIRGLDLVLPRIASTTSGAPWLMLLGENGCGKSSVLQAIALTLMGEETRSGLDLDAASFVTNGERTGSVEVHLAGATSPVRLEFSRRSPRFDGEAEPKMLLLAYGATRLLPRGRLETPLPGGPVRVANMFDPFSPIGNVTEWLLGFGEKRFDALARALKSVLDLGQEDRLIRNRRAGRIEVQAYGTRVPLEHLSDGYQSVVALATDIMAVLLERWPSVDAAEGTVLIDELGAHLHPRWRMRIVPSLRQVFPRVQFLASTHDPLCLRGLEGGEVAVMRRGPEGEIVAVTDLPSLAGLRVDQLLTSEHFGLNSTIDPELDALFAEYYALKAKRTLSSAERRRHDELHERLDGLQVLGSTRRERLVLEAADEFIAREPVLTDPNRRIALRKATQAQIADLWAEVNPGQTR